VIARYVGANPNGSAAAIAGIANAAGNVVGLMPHPEHAIDAITGPGPDGLGFFAPLLSGGSARDGAAGGAGAAGTRLPGAGVRG
jgi:phosphoribosylformylglycinamidine synthase subunit PurQ / glutaminase